MKKFKEYIKYLCKGTKYMRVIVETLRCKYCGGENVVKYGTFRGAQRWWCNKCKRKFSDNDALPKMKTPIEQVASALSMYYEGMSLAKVRRHLEQMYNNSPSDSTIYAWIKKFSKQAIDETDGDIPDVGGWRGPTKTDTQLR